MLAVLNAVKGKADLIQKVTVPWGGFGDGGKYFDELKLHLQPVNIRRILRSMIKEDDDVLSFALDNIRVSLFPHATHRPDRTA